MAFRLWGFRVSHKLSLIGSRVLGLGVETLGFRAPKPLVSEQPLYNKGYPFSYDSVLVRAAPKIKRAKGYYPGTFGVALKP